MRLELFRQAGGLSTLLSPNFLIGQNSTIEEESWGNHGAGIRNVERGKSGRGIASTKLDFTRARKCTVVRLTGYPTAVGATEICQN